MTRSTSDLDPETKQEIGAIAGRALGLKVGVMCAVKTEHASPADHVTPLGSVLVLFIMKLRLMPVWWWRKRRVFKAVRAAVPLDRMVFVYPISQGYIRHR